MLKNLQRRLTNMFNYIENARNANAPKILDYEGTEKSITIPADANGLDIGITENPYIEEIIIPAYITEVNDLYFDDLKNLKRIVYEGTGNIFVGANFWDCPNVEEIVINGETYQNKAPEGYGYICGSVYGKEQNLIRYLDNCGNATFHEVGRVTRLGEFSQRGKRWSALAYSKTLIGALPTGKGCHTFLVEDRTTKAYQHNTETDHCYTIALKPIRKVL
jgi:hypothetical protein